jgi:hypothetical protein
MPRKFIYSLAFGAAAAGLTWATWPGAPADPATVIGRVDVIATVVMLAGLPWATRRVFGPAAGGWLPRAVRAGGYAAVFTLVLVKARVERPEYAALPGRGVLAGIWVGEIVFLLVMTAYMAGLLAVTARRTPVGRAALAIGTGAGVALGLALYALSAVPSPRHVAVAWPAWAYSTARLLAVVLVLGTAFAAGLAAARRTSGRGSALPLADTRARQGVAAGLCTGTAAALLVSVLGLSTAALLPHGVGRFQWVLPTGHVQPAIVLEFELGISHSAAGYLLVFVLFPLLGAGLGAWGGLFAAGQPGQRPRGGGGGGGGGGPDGPAPAPPPPAWGRYPGGDREPAILAGGHRPGFPAGAGTPPAPEERPAAPDRRERVAVGAAGHPGS